MRAKFIRNLLVLCVAVITAFSSAHAQDASRIYIEPTGFSLGTNFGLTDLWGDVGTKSIVDHYTNSKYFDKVAVMGGMLGRYTIHPCLSVRAMVDFGAVYATDEWNYDKAKKATSQGDDSYQRYARGQASKSNILEGTMMMEFSPFRYNPESKMAHRKGQIYLVAGIGYFHFTPYSYVAGGTKWVEIYDLHIEGDGFGPGYPPSYSQWQLNIPMGLGYRWDIGQHLNIGVEFLYRKTFTDYLDGVSGKYIDPTVYAQHMSASQALEAAAVADKGWLKGLEPPNAAGNIRGDASTKDAYSSIGVTFYYKVFSRTKEWWHNR